MDPVRLAFAAKGEAPDAAKRLGPPLISFLLIVWLLKVVMVLTLGPATFPDTSLYLHLGREILDNPDWWRDGGWGTGFAPAPLLRPYGYPLLVAAAERLAGSQFALLLGVFQAGVSVATMGLFVWLADGLLKDRRLLAGATLLYALSGFALFDIALLTDSLYSSLFLTVLLLLGAQIQGRLAPGLGIASLLGLIWAMSLSLRDVGLFHTVLPLAGVIVAARRHRLGWGRTAMLGVGFLLPVALFVAAIVAWNLDRTGHAFFSITGAVNWLWPSVNMTDRGLADPFGCADLVCRTAQRHGIGKGMEGVDGLIEALWNDAHLDPLALGHLTFHHFLDTVVAHPRAFLLTVLGNVQFGHLADLVFNPLANINEFCRLHSALGERLVPGLRELFQGLRHGDLRMLPGLLLSLPLAGAALAGLIVFLIGPPLAARRRGGGDSTAAMLFFWAATILFVGSYSVVHLEMRHAMPIVPFILLVTAWAVESWSRPRFRS